MNAAILELASRLPRMDAASAFRARKAIVGLAAKGYNPSEQRASDGRFGSVAGDHNHQVAEEIKKRLPNLDNEDRGRATKLIEKLRGGAGLTADDHDELANQHASLASDALRAGIAAADALEKRASNMAPADAARARMMAEKLRGGQATPSKAEPEIPADRANFIKNTATIPADWTAGKTGKSLEMTGETGLAAAPAMRRSADLMGAATAVGENYAADPEAVAAMEKSPHGEAIRNASAWAKEVLPKAEAALNHNATAVAKGLPDGKKIEAAGPKDIRKAIIVYPEDLPAGTRDGLLALAAKADRIETVGLGNAMLIQSSGTDASRAIQTIANLNGPKIGIRLTDVGYYDQEHLATLWAKSTSPAQGGGKYKQITAGAYVRQGGDGLYRLTDHVGSASKSYSPNEARASDGRFGAVAGDHPAISDEVERRASRYEANASELEADAKKYPAGSPSHQSHINEAKRMQGLADRLRGGSKTAEKPATPPLANLRPTATTGRPSIGKGGDPAITIAGDRKKTLAHIKQFLGKGATPMTLARVAGAPDGSKVEILSTLYNPYLNDGVGRITAHITGPGFEATREIYKGHVENVSIKIKQTGTGLGTKVLAMQVAECHASGIKRLRCYAAKDSDMNGFSTWAKLGYDGPIDHNLKIPAELGSPKMVSDLMKTPAGRAFWQEKGTAFFASFDTDPASQNSKVLAAYIASRATRKAMDAAEVDQADGVENPPELTAEDEAALAAIWDSLAKQ